MKFPFEIFIAQRYLKSRQKTGFINLITYISIIGVAIGVAALIIVLSVMNGFESEIRSRVIGFDSHIRLRTFHDQGMFNYPWVMDQIQDIPHIKGMAPYIMNNGLINCNGKSDGIIVRAADPKQIHEVSDLPSKIYFGELHLDPIDPNDPRSLPGIVVGRWVADRLLMSLGDTCTVFSLAGVHSMFQMPPVKQFVVTGIFETGMYEFDNAYVYISIQAAQKLYKLDDKVSGIEIMLDDLNSANTVVDSIDARLGFPYFALTWFDMRKSLFTWMELEKIAAFVVLSLIILVAAMNIISTIIMSVMDKTREIGILKSMGATSQSIMRIFLYDGLIVGVFGTILGFLLGFGLCWAQIQFKFFSLDGEVYFIDTLPVKMQILDFIFIGVIAICISFLSTLYPAKKASQLAPVDAIRYE